MVQNRIWGIILQGYALKHSSIILQYRLGNKRKKPFPGFLSKKDFPVSSPTVIEYPQKLLRTLQEITTRTHLLPISKVSLHSLVSKKFDVGTILRQTRKLVNTEGPNAECHGERNWDMKHGKNHFYWSEDFWGAGLWRSGSWTWTWEPYCVIDNSV